MVPNIPKFIWDQKFVTLPMTEVSCEGRTIIVTGANSGLGKEAARRFAALGAAKVILAVRSLDKGEAAKKDIEGSTNCAAGAVEVWKLDLQNYASVKAFADRAAKDLERLDAVCENAGISPKTWAVAEGQEATITTNVSSTLLLALLILPKLRETGSKYYANAPREGPWAKPTLTIVSSEVHEWSAFKEPKKAAADGTAGAKQRGILTNLADEKLSPSMMERYMLSKLMEVFFVREMANQRQDSPVTFNYVNPGFCHSELSGDDGFMKVFKFIMARSTEHGSRNLTYAVLQAGPQSHGQYVTNCQVHEPSSYVRSDKGKTMQKLIWEELSAQMEEIAPGSMSKL